MHDGITPTKFGRYHVAEPFRAELAHLYQGAPLKTAEWEIPVPVLDQEDLQSQGIDTSQLIKGAQKVDALGSCTANATVASLSELYKRRGMSMLQLGLPSNDGTLGITVSGAAAAREDEEFAIAFYDLCTHQTGDPAAEWPPTDCGSTGLFCCQQLIRQKFITSYQTGTGGQALASMLQSGSVIMGSPWLNSWMEPNSLGFVDGDGSMDALQIAMNSGVAGGHETCVYKLPMLFANPDGTVNLERSWVQVRNSWSASWGLSGDYRIHLSTIDWLAGNIDLKQFVL